MNSPHIFAATAVRQYGHTKVFSIDVNEARYFGIPWRALGDFGKKKFENIFALSQHGVITRCIYG